MIKKTLSLPPWYDALALPDSPSFAHSPYDLEVKLTRAITQGDKATACGILEKINALRKPRLASDKARSLKNSLIASCTIFSRAAISGGVDDDLAFTLSDQCINYVEAETNLERLKAIEIKILCRFVDLVRQHQVERRHIVVWQAVKEIKSHIKEPIGLTKTARAIGVSPPYLSALFTRIMGLSFCHYVHQVKVLEAEYHLKFSRIDIAEIAQQLGFENQAYFARVFKHVTGITPSDFRKTHI